MQDLENRLHRFLPSSSMKALLIFLSLIFVAKILLSVSFPLISGEIYYRIWSESLQWGYYDHPPMIAYWIRLGMEMLGDNRLGVRLLPVLSSVFGSLCIYWLAREFGIVESLARRSVVWVQSAWVIVMVGMLAVPDAPIALFWMMTMACSARAARLSCLGWWLIAGFMAGLSFVSKYTGLFLLPGILLWLVTSERYRAQLASPGPWLAALVSIAVFLPNILWNANHDWGTFVKQIGRAIPERFDLVRPLIWVFVQTLLLGPVLFVLASFGGWKILQKRADFSKPPAEPDSNDGIKDCMHFMTALSAPLIIYMLFHGLHSEVKWNWLAPSIPGLTLLALLSTQSLDAAYHKRLNRAVPMSACGLFALALCLFFVPSAARHFDFGWELRQWPQLAQKLEDVSAKYGAQWIGSGIYRTNALLYQHVSDRSLPVQIIERFRYPPDNPSWSIDPVAPGLVFEQAGFFDPDKLNACFYQIEKLPSEFRTDFAGKRYAYDVYLVIGARKNWVEDGCYE